MQDNQILEDDLQKEKTTKHYGTARIKLDWLHFKNNRLNDKQVRDLRIRLGRACRRLDAQSHIPAIIDQQDFLNAIHISGLSEGLLPATSRSEFLELSFWSGYQLECLHGRHRIQAAKQALLRQDMWWTIDILADPLRQAFEFDTKSLQSALFTSCALDPSVRGFLPEAISKLGRYYSVANDLVDAARNSRYTISRHILIESLEKPAIDASSITDGLLGFEAVFRRNIGLLHEQGDWQRHTGPLKVARTRFQSRISYCATAWKIHAEIQLLFFYEEKPNVPHPRMICSSKSACYLCDLFIKCHGQFLTPRTHGKLYDKWSLPERSPIAANPSIVIGLILSDRASSRIVPPLPFLYYH